MKIKTKALVVCVCQPTSKYPIPIFKMLFVAIICFEAAANELKKKKKLTSLKRVAKLVVLFNDDSYSWLLESKYFSSQFTEIRSLLALSTSAHFRGNKSHKFMQQNC